MRCDDVAVNRGVLSSASTTRCLTTTLARPLRASSRRSTTSRCSATTRSSSASTSRWSIETLAIVLLRALVAAAEAKFDIAASSRDLAAPSAAATSSSTSRRAGTTLIEACALLRRRIVVQRDVEVVAAICSVLSLAFCVRQLKCKSTNALLRKSLMRSATCFFSRSRSSRFST